MNKQQLYTIHEYKNNIKRIENEKLSNQALFTYTLFVYLLFGSINQAGKILLAGSYNSQLGIYSWNVYQTLGNLTWFFFFLTCPICLKYIPQMVMRIKFRALLFIGSLGPQILMLVPFYSEICMSQPELICKESIIYVLAFIISSLGGVLQGVLVVGLLFYFVNISSGEEKILYLGGFALIYNFIWVTGALTGGLIMFIVDDNISKYYAVILVVEFIFSLFFLMVQEPNQDSRISNIKKKIRSISKNQSSSIQQSQKLKNDGTTELNQNLLIQSSNNLTIKQTLENVTLQCFSLEEADLQKVLTGNFTDQQKGTEVEKFDQISYLNKMFITWRQLGEQRFFYLIPSISAICYIQVSVLLYLYKLVNIQLTSEQQTLPIEDLQSRMVDKTLTSYGYYGLGQVIGMFIIAVVGDLKDKVKLIMGLLIIMQVGIIIGAVSVHIKPLDFSGIFCLILGFCESGILATILTIITYQYVYHIYMFDMIYYLYNFGLSFAALTLLVCDYTNDQACIIFLSLIGIIAMITICFYFKSLKL